VTETTTDNNALHSLGVRKRIALIAHDNRKADLLAWAKFNRGTLSKHELLATGTTGALLADELGLEVHRFLSGPLGGDQQVGAAIAEGRIDVVIFFWDPLEPHPHDVDVKALLRVAVVHNIAIACNRATADFVLSSPILGEEYVPSFTPDPATAPPGAVAGSRSRAAGRGGSRRLLRVRRSRSWRCRGRRRDRMSSRWAW
jgi:methylglyoxal synthase